MADVLGVAALGVPLLLGGTLLAADFRGFAARYSKLAFDLGSAFTFRRDNSPQRRQERLRFAYILSRIVGAIFGAFGALMIFTTAPQLLIVFIRLLAGSGVGH